MTRPKVPNPATVRSKARYARAAAIIPAITLDAEHARMLAKLRKDSSMSCADLIRCLIEEADDYGPED